MRIGSDTLSGLWLDAMDQTWFGAPDEVTTSGATFYNCVLEADSMEYDLDLGYYGYDRKRWTKLVRQYLAPSPTLEFLERAEQIGMGKVKLDAVAGLMTKYSVLDGSKHFFGNCILAFTYYGTRRNPTISMHSRTCYLPTVGLIDLALARALAAEIGRDIRRSLDQFHFMWYADSLQVPSIQSLPTMARFPDRVNWLDYPKERTNTRIAKMLRPHWDQAWSRVDTGKMPEYGPMRRVVTRLTEIERGDDYDKLLPRTLTLESLRRR